MKVQIRGKTAIISGYVNAVERESKVLPPYKSGGDCDRPFVERVAAGVFTKALERNRAVGLKFNHIRTIGGTASGDLLLREDNIGLYAEATVRDAEVLRAAEEGKLKGWSFGFVNPQYAETETDGIVHRTITDLALTEVSLLDVPPAYVGTSIECRDGTDTVIETRGMADTAEAVEKAKETEQGDNKQAISYEAYDLLAQINNYL